MSAKRFLFICGAARSGTSPVWGFVAEHPRIALGLERYIKRSLGPQFLSPALFEKDRFFSLRAGDTFYTSLQEFHPYYGRLAPRFDDCLLYGDKIPKLYENYPRLEENFSHPKVIFVLRNIFDIASSVNQRADKGKNWRSDRDYSKAVRDWNRALHATLENIDAMDICVVEYETFFSGQCDPKALFEFLDIEWRDELDVKYLLLP